MIKEMVASVVRASHKKINRCIADLLGDEIPTLSTIEKAGITVVIKRIEGGRKTYIYQHAILIRVVCCHSPFIDCNEGEG